jgi:hypothetical protein
VVRIQRKLMDLFDQVLREYREEPPVLADVVIERAFERFEPHLVAYFSDGHHALVAVQTDDVFQFCQRYSAWSVGRLRCALASEGRAIYAQMLASREASNNRGELGHREPRLAVAAPQPDAPRRLRDWWSWPRTIGRSVANARSAYREAHARGIRLLNECLSPAQREQYEKYGYFEVIGGTTGKSYRIRKGAQMNVEELGNNGKRVSLLCFIPKGGLVVGDVMLAQKLALELFEPHALAVANTIPGRTHPLGPLP